MPFSREAWAAALKSGEYKQTTEGYLRKNDQFCCLGVACEIAGIPAREANEPGVFQYNGKVGLPDRNTLHTLGINFAEADELADANDKGVSFDRIADYLLTGDKKFLWL